jgi:hypothetical protein
MVDALDPHLASVLVALLGAAGGVVQFPAAAVTVFVQLLVFPAFQVNDVVSAAPVAGSESSRVLPPDGLGDVKVASLAPVTERTTLRPGPTLDTVFPKVSVTATLPEKVLLLPKPLPQLQVKKHGLGTAKLESVLTLVHASLLALAAATRTRPLTPVCALGPATVMDVDSAL